MEELPRIVLLIKGEYHLFCESFLSDFIFFRSIECLDLLTSNGADFKLKDNFERLPLHYAAAQAHFQCVFTLVGIGSPINDRYVLIEKIKGVSNGCVLF